MLSIRQCYEILGIRHGCIEKIRSTYKQLALKYHPDKNAGSKTAEEKFKQVSSPPFLKPRHILTTSDQKRIRNHLTHSRTHNLHFKPSKVPTSTWASTSPTPPTPLPRPARRHTTRALSKRQRPLHRAHAPRVRMGDSHKMGADLQIIPRRSATPQIADDQEPGDPGSSRESGGRKI